MYKRQGDDQVLVRTDDPDGFAEALRRDQVGVNKQDDGALVVSADGRDVAQRAQSQGVLLWEITPQQASLEQVYMSMTSDSVEYRSSDPNAGLGSGSANSTARAESTGGHSGGGAHTAAQPEATTTGQGENYQPSHSTEQAPWNQEEK